MTVREGKCLWAELLVSCALVDPTAMLSIGLRRLNSLLELDRKSTVPVKMFPGLKI